MSERQDHEQLEFNDGVGDMLRERRSGPKSINRSAFTAGLIVLFAVIVFAGLFKLGAKTLFQGASSPSVVVPVDQVAVAKVDSENQKLIKEMEALLSQASANVSIETDQKQTAPTVDSRPQPVNSRPKTEPAVAIKAYTPAAVEPVRKKKKPVVVRREPRPKVATKLHYVNAGSFSGRPDASALSERLKTVGYPVYIKESGDGFIVQVGVFRSRTEARHLVADLQSKGFNAALITR
jgi:cell division septation protein DedD